MKIISNIPLTIGLLLMISCQDMISKSGNNYYNSDDYLIEQIQYSVNKIDIEYNQLPTDAMTTIEELYGSEVFLSEMLAAGLGYELISGNMASNEDDFHKIYFNLDGRELERKRGEGKRDWECFDLVYPVTFIMPDGSTITITNREDWEELKSWYDDNPNSEERPTLQYPVDILYEDGTTLTINSDEEMREAKENCIECFALIFPVIFTMPDGTTITVSSDDDEGWEELKDWYESNPNTEFDWNLVFPVNIILEDGTTTTVNSELEMDAIKLSCE